MKSIIYLTTNMIKVADACLIKLQKTKNNYYQPIF